MSTQDPSTQASTLAPSVMATFTPLKGPKLERGESIPVHFNPVSLQYTVTNTLEKDKDKTSKKQFISQAQAKLTMDLVFDSSDNGQDVRVSTVKIAALMEPDKKASSGKKDVAPVVLFEWGKYKFQGMMESYKETLDFFSTNGVPLRASVNISLTQQDKIFETDSADVGRNSNLTLDAVDVPTSSTDHTTSAATQGGDPDASRALAAFNGQESMRFTAGASLTVSGSIQLGPPAAFAAGGAGIGIGAGAGVGVGVGAGIGISGGAGIGVGAGAAIGIGGGAGIGISGGTGMGLGAGAAIGVGGGAGIGIGGISVGSQASAGVSASEGAFAGLRVSSQKQAFSLDTDRFLVRSETVSVATDSGATFQVGGQAVLESSSGLRADVGVSADLRSRIRFEVD